MAAVLSCTYDPARLSIVLSILGTNATAIPLTGWAEDEMITIERNEDLFSIQVGCLGEVVRSVNRNATGIATLKFQHSSPSVKYIEALKTTDAILQAGGVGAPPVMTLKVVDPSSADCVFASSVFLFKDAVHSWGKEAGTREYQFYCCNITTAPNETLSILQNVSNAFGLL